MKTIASYAIRRSVLLCFFLFLLASDPARWVILGLRQGIGLHGYIITSSGSDGSMPTLISVWAALIEFLVLATFAWALLLVALFRKRKQRPDSHIATRVQPSPLEKL